MVMEALMMMIEGGNGKARRRTAVLVFSVSLRRKRRKRPNHVPCMWEINEED